MIVLPKRSFQFCCSSGSLGLDGSGSWFSKLFNFNNFDELAIVTNTLTLKPVKKIFFSEKYVNLGTAKSIYYPNPGVKYWSEKIYPAIPKYRVIIPSVYSESVFEVVEIAKRLNDIDVSMVEYSLLSNSRSILSQIDVFVSFLNAINHKVILKLDYGMPITKIATYFKNDVFAFNLIDNVPWSFIHKSKSPYTWTGVIGPCIREFSKEVLRDIKLAGVQTKIISTGGITSTREAEIRLNHGADAVSFRTILKSGSPFTYSRILPS